MWVRGGESSYFDVYPLESPRTTKGGPSLRCWEKAARSGKHFHCFLIEMFEGLCGLSTPLLNNNDDRHGWSIQRRIEALCYEKMFMTRMCDLAPRRPHGQCFI